MLSPPSLSPLLFEAKTNIQNLGFFRIFKDTLLSPSHLFCILSLLFFSLASSLILNSTAQHNKYPFHLKFRASGVFTHLKKN